MADKVTLETRRSQVLARHKVLESVPGSGWHKDDPAFKASGHPKLTDRPVAIHDDDTVYFVGDCVGFVREEAAAACELIGDQAVQGEIPLLDIQSCKVCGSVGSGTGDTIELTPAQFNALSYGLDKVGVHVCSTQIIAPEEERT